MALRTYSPKDYIVYFNGNELSDQLVSVAVSYEENAYTLQRGIDGETTRSQITHNDATVEITIKATSKANDFLSAMHELSRNRLGVGTFAIKDLYGSDAVSSSEAFINGAPSLEIGAEVGDRTWTIQLINAKIFFGSKRI